MDKTWQEMFDTIKDEINKGDIFDDIIWDKMFMAVRSIEQNWTYSYMEKIAEWRLNPDAFNPRIITLPEDIKIIRSVRLLSTTPERVITKAFPDQFSITSPNPVPNTYFIQGGRYLWLDGDVTEETRGQLLYDAYTLKSQMLPDETHPLITHGQTALLGTTMQFMAPTAREPSWVETYGGMASIGIQTLLTVDEEQRMSDNEVVFGTGGS